MPDGPGTYKKPGRPKKKKDGIDRKSKSKDKVDVKY